MCFLFPTCAALSVTAAQRSTFRYKYHVQRLYVIVTLLYGAKRYNLFLTKQTVCTYMHQIYNHLLHVSVVDRQLQAATQICEPYRIVIQFVQLQYNLYSYNTICTVTIQFVQLQYNLYSYNTICTVTIHSVLIKS